MENLTNILPANITEALGWTLLHSFWQAALLLATFQIGISFFLKSQIKYNVSVGLLCLQIVASVITFCMIFEPYKQFTQYPTVQNLSNTTQIFLSKTIEYTTFYHQAFIWFSSKIDVFVNIWMAGIAFYLVRFGFNFWQVNQLKTKELNIPSLKIRQIYENIFTKVSLSKNIQIMESARVYTPVLIGYIKPIILLPIGLCGHLSVQEIEAIIAHELAHSKRNDYLINLFQSIIDIVYFFNPALLILSSQIRDIRENCCDEFASEICGDSIPIAKALVNLEIFRQEASLAMAFGRNGNQLKNRIGKLLGISPEKSNQNKASFFIVGLLLCAIFYININKIYAQNPEKITKQNHKNSIKYKDNRQYDLYRDNGKSEIVIKDKKGTQLHLNQENGSVFLNGKEYKLSKADSAKMAVHNIEIAKLEKEMAERNSRIAELGTKIGLYTQNISQVSSPISSKSQEIAKVSQKIKAISQKHANISQQLSNLDEEENPKMAAELEQKIKRYDEELENYENQIDKLSDEIEEISTKMELHNAPLDSLSNLIEKESEPMEEIGRKIEKESEEIWNLYPSEVKAEYEKLMFDSNFKHFPPTPPRPPAPPRIRNLTPPRPPISTPRPPVPPRAPVPPLKSSPTGALAPKGNQKT